MLKNYTVIRLSDRLKKVARKSYRRYFGPDLHSYGSPRYEVKIMRSDPD